MTVDKVIESPPVFNSGENGVTEQEALKTLKDFFTDYQDGILLKALSAGKIGAKYDVGICINWLLDQQQISSVRQSREGDGASIRPDANEAESSRGGTSLAPVIPPKRTGDVKEVTDNDLQKAIQNSLREQGPAGLGGQISAEEQELSRVIEASIAASKTRDLRQSSLFFTDPPNPHERERLVVWPVGLKNVGNTCWFSVVVQALFHLPAFRHWIYDLNLTNVAPVSEAQPSSSSRVFATKELEFIFELRRLFALLLASKRKYVDPSNVVEVLRKQESLQLRNGGVDNQQDVSEFTHLVLEWIEEAFNYVRKRQSESRQRDDNANSIEEAVDCEMDSDSNPIQKLFYGSVLIESRSSESSSTKEDRFSQYPLQVIGFDNLHDSFEASMCQEEFDEVTKATTSIEHWLTESPPVFLFELSRFRYNQGDNKPEKIHSRFVFPQTLYIDRYLEKNQQIVRQKRDTVHHLRQHLKLLKAQLNKYEQYGSGGSKMALSNVLQCTLKFVRGASFAHRRQVDSTMVWTDVNMESPRGMISAFDSAKQTEIVESTVPDAGGTVLMEIEQAGTASKSEDVFSMELEEPRPKLATAEEVGVLEHCLARWAREVEEQVEDLKSKINEIENSINVVYQEDCMKKRAYVLHAVLVHEGQATLGHYWTFVADHKTQLWKKFNDVQVTEVDWEQLERDCYGGFQNTSAYCLIYVDADTVDLINESPFSSLQPMSLQAKKSTFHKKSPFGTSFMSSVDDLLGSLPEDLRPYVTQDNGDFCSEILSWDERHRLVTAGHDGSKPGSGDKTDRVLHSVPTNDMIENFDMSKNYVQDVIKNQINGDAQVIPSVIQSEIRRVRTLWRDFLASKDLLKDPRLPNMAAYGVAWMAPSVDDRVLGRILFDLFHHHLSSLWSQNASCVQLLSQLSSAYVLNENETKLYYDIHRDFNLFSRSVLLISFAIDTFHNKKNYTSALQYLILAEDYTRKLVGTEESRRDRAVSWDLLMNYKRGTITKLSNELYDNFRAANDQDDVNKCLSTIDTFLVPVLNGLAQQNEEGLQTSEDIKATWLALLNDVNRRKFGSDAEKRLQDLVDTIQAVGSMKANNPGMTAKFKITNDVPQRYLKAVQTAVGARMLSTTSSS